MHPPFPFPFIPLLLSSGGANRLSAAMDFQGDTVHFDPTNPQARKYIWDKAYHNYYTKGIKTFWLDEAEPEYTVYDFDNYRYHRGPNVQIGNIYPVEYSKAFYEGQESAGQKNIVNLVRCAWAGSQKFGALVWSGDIGTPFSSPPRAQFPPLSSLNP